MIIGRNGDPTVATKVPSADVLMPTPQVGHAKSLINSGLISPRILMAGPSATSEKACPVGKYDISSLNGVHVESSPGAKVIIGLVRTGLILVHSSFTPAVPITWRYSEGDVLI